MAAYQTHLEWNRWKRPVLEFGENEIELKRSILRLEVLKHIHINADEWDRHCQAIDVILKTIEQGVKRFANESFEGLKIRGYVKQGNAQEGLKIENSLEFDCKLLFDINQMIISKVRLRNSRDVDLLKLEVRNAEHLMFLYPWIDYLQIFETGNDGKYYINSQNLQERVFKIIINKAMHLVNDHLPPTVGIDLTLDTETVMDVNETFSIFGPQAGRMPNTPMQILHIDIVPAMVLYEDEILLDGSKLSVYAVMKWRNSPIPSENQYIWQTCSSGYEGFIFGQKELHPSQLYLMTACRVVMSWMDSQKYKLKHLRKVLESYHLKTVCLHLMSISKVDRTNTGNIAISGVRQAVGYYMYFLKLSINCKLLPHFFYGNPDLHNMFPQSTFGQELIPKNLYENIDPITNFIAIYDYGKVLFDLRGFFAAECELDKYQLEKIHKLLNVKFFFGLRFSTGSLRQEYNYIHFYHFVMLVVFPICIALSLIIHFFEL